MAESTPTPPQTKPIGETSMPTTTLDPRTSRFDSSPADRFGLFVRVSVAQIRLECSPRAYPGAYLEMDVRRPQVRAPEVREPLRCRYWWSGDARSPAPVLR